MRALSRFNVLKASRCALLQCGRGRACRAWPRLEAIWPRHATHHRCHNRCKHHASQCALPRGDRRSRELHCKERYSSTDWHHQCVFKWYRRRCKCPLGPRRYSCNGTLPDYTLHIAAGKGVERKITAALNCKNVSILQVPLMRLSLKK